MIRKLIRGLRALLHLLARPVRATRGQGEVVLQPYRGYGTAEEVFLIGRAFRQPTGSSSEEPTDAALSARLARARSSSGKRSVTCSQRVIRARGSVSTWVRIRVVPLCVPKTSSA